MPPLFEFFNHEIDFTKLRYHMKIIKTGAGKVARCDKQNGGILKLLHDSVEDTIRIQMPFALRPSVIQIL